MTITNKARQAARKKVQANPNSRSSAEKYYARAEKTGAVVHAALNHQIRQKMATGNAPQRALDLCTGVTPQTSDYTLTMNKGGGFTVSGTRAQLEAFGRDVLGRNPPKKESAFSAAYTDLVPRNKWFTTIMEDNTRIPFGPFPASARDKIFKYTFYNPDFKEGADFLNIAKWVYEKTESDSSDSDEESHSDEESNSDEEADNE